MHVHVVKSLQSCPTLCHPMDCSPPSSSLHGILLANTGVGCHDFLQGIFPTHGSNLYLLCLLHWQAGSVPVAPPGKSIHVHLLIKAIVLYCHLLFWAQTWCQCSSTYNPATISWVKCPSHFLHFGETVDLQTQECGLCSQPVYTRILDMSNSQLCDLWLPFSAIT